MVTLSLRALNRATLARQLLLTRADLPAIEAIEHLIGMQAQLAMPPFVGLWSRLANFQRAELAELLAERQVVRATLMRATLHLISTHDYVKFRTTIQPVLDAAGADIATRRGGAAFDRMQLLQLAYDFIAAQPRTFAEISAMLAAALPEHDIGALRYTVRTQLRLLQVPTGGEWSYPGNPAFTLAEPWLGRQLDSQERLHELARRYLAAFGPATVADMQTWSGLAKLKEVFAELRAELVVYHDEQRRELFDLSTIHLPDEKTPAPVRFLPEFDNILLAHSKRTRIVADEHRTKVFLPGLRVAATVLIDGFVAGIWKVEENKRRATLTITLFKEPSLDERTALLEEAEQLVRFITPTAVERVVQY
ncbi:winged helix DNA-binding domain-containing protein [Candidatus Gracilibacteria bacterium]|nr:winged helix DNA-binding domain-containing protein [Candidatus Gracilibacteria bacterium]